MDESSTAELLFTFAVGGLYTSGNSTLFGLELG